MKITSIALAALPLAAAGELPVDCVAFQDSGSSPESTLGMGRCLESGDAICSSTGSWAFGIDRTDGTVKLWEDDRVSSFLLLMPIRSFKSIRISDAMPELSRIFAARSAPLCSTPLGAGREVHQSFIHMYIYIYT